MQRICDKIFIGSYIERFKYEVHIVTQDYVSDEYVSLFKNRGYILHLVPSKKDGVIKNISSLCKVFKDINCDIVHAHMTTTNAFPMFAAILAGVKIRISHSHLDMKLNWFWKMVCFFNKVFSTNLVACGEEAGKCLYGKSDFIIFNNAIDLKKYKYNLSTREYLRNKYKIKSNDNIMLPVFLDCKTLSFVENTYYHYRLNGGSILGAYNRKMLEQIEILYNILFQILTDMQCEFLKEQLLADYLSSMVLCVKNELKSTKKIYDISQVVKKIRNATYTLEALNKTDYSRYSLVNKSIISMISKPKRIEKLQLVLFRKFFYLKMKKISY